MYLLIEYFRFFRFWGFAEPLLDLDTQRKNVRPASSRNQFFLKDSLTSSNDNSTIWTEMEITLMAQGAEEFQGGDVSGSDGNYQFFSYLVPDASRCGIHWKQNWLSQRRWLIDDGVWEIFGELIAIIPSFFHSAVWVFIPKNVQENDLKHHSELSETTFLRWMSRSSNSSANPQNPKNRKYSMSRYS